MMTWNETNVVELVNKKGTLHIEHEPTLGVEMTVNNPEISLKMTGYYQAEELQYVVNNRNYARIKHGYFSPSIGAKKVLETIFARKGIDGENDPSITFLSEDTTYQYPLSIQEWNEILSFFAQRVEID